MPTTQPTTVVGVFHDRRRAEEAVAALERAGFTADQLGFATRDDTFRHGRSDGAEAHVTTDTGPGSGAASGAAAGGVLGGIVGAAAALAVPGVGPALAAGILGPVLASAAAGAGIGDAGGGLVGGLVTTGVTEEDARYYDSEFRSGRSLVTVRVGSGSRAEEARRILREHGAYDAESRADATVAMPALDASPARNRAADTRGAADATGVLHVPEIEERLSVEKRSVPQGDVRIHKRVETEQQSIPVEVEHEEIRVEQRTVEPRPLAENVSIGAFEEGTIRIPIRGEEVVVHKEAVVTGEVVVNKDRTVERREIADTVRRQLVEIDEIDEPVARGAAEVDRR
ncbi:MAG TPA: YsnF/AvaK domain-containing protein [Chloroflexota bacterium]|nr:YsnF/AvaK domain-containing protein [Chloroflexota bacterium]